MRRLLIALTITLLPSFAIAHGHGGGGGGHGGMGGGHGGMGGGHMAGGWSGHGGASMAGARTGGWTGHMAAWQGGRMAAWNGRAGNWNGRVGNLNRFHHGHFVHRHGRVFFVGGPWWWGDYGYSDYGCWQWVSTRWGPRRIWACGDYY